VAASPSVARGGGGISLPTFSTRKPASGTLNQSGERRLQLVEVIFVQSEVRQLQLTAVPDLRHFLRRRNLSENCVRGDATGGDLAEAFTRNKDERGRDEIGGERERESE
jgi:hypothetical protein